MVRLPVVQNGARFATVRPIESVITPPPEAMVICPPATVAFAALNWPPPVTSGVGQSVLTEPVIEPLPV